MERERWEDEAFYGETALRFDDEFPTRRLAPLLRRPVEVLVLEMSGVLYDDSFWPRWLWRRLAHRGCAASFETFWSVCEQEYLPEVYAGRRELWDALSAYLAELGLSRGRIAEVRIAAEARRLKWQEELRPFPGVAATLASLASRPLKLAVLTNSCCSGVELQTRLRTLGLADYFEQVVSSRDLATALPATAGWQEMTRRLDVAPARAAFVARDPHVLRGAAAAGFAAVGVHQTRPSSAIASCQHFCDLLEVLAPRSAAQAA